MPELTNPHRLLEVGLFWLYYYFFCPMLSGCTCYALPDACFVQVRRENVVYRVDTSCRRREEGARCVVLHI